MVDQYNRWFPDYPGQQPWQDPQFVRIHGQQQQTQTAQQPTQQQPAAAASMTPPIIHADIVQVDGEQAAAQYPVGVGASQMIMTRDESAIFIKIGTANGYTLIAFDRRPPTPESTSFNPAEYVRLDALPSLVAAEVKSAVAAAMTQPAKLARSKKEMEAAE